jgi:serine/threonine protein kinase
MQPCPSAEELSHWLEEAEEGDGSALADHVEACPHCQSTVEELLQHAAPAGVSHAAVGSGGARLRQEFVQRLQLSPHAAFGVNMPGVAPSTLGPATGQDSEGDVVGGDFRIERRLGAGGMGIVYSAWQISLNRRVALKLLGGPVQTAAGIARFRREAQAVAKLNHPGIVRIHFIGQDNQLCYMAMEYVEGISFRDLIRRLRTASGEGASLEEIVSETQAAGSGSCVLRFDVPDPSETSIAPICKPEGLSGTSLQLIEQRSYVRRCVELVRDACLAIAHSHDHGVVHRDIKPANLLLNKDGKVLVIDFGLAQLYDDETITYTGQLVGTPMYMSPEQVLGQKQIDGRTDIYSLAMVLYELLTLEPPYTASNRESLFRKIVTQWLPPVGWRNRAVRDDLAAVVHHGLAKDPDERYGSMIEMARDLERVLAGQPVMAPAYRHRMDVREVIAQRPTAIMYMAFLTYLFALVAAVVVAEIVSSYVGGISTVVDGLFYAAWILPPVGFLMYLGNSSLAARSWSRWGCLSFGLSLCGLMVWHGSLVVSGRMLSHALFLSAILGVSGVAYMMLAIHPRITRWYRFAADVRAEFARQRHVRRKWQSVRQD